MVLAAEKPSGPEIKRMVVTISATPGALKKSPRAYSAGLRLRPAAVTIFEDGRKDNGMKSVLQTDNIRKGPLEKLREFARAILSASAEEEMRLQHRDFLKVNFKGNDVRTAE